ncbi:hypothetical protein PVAP13_6KG393541 [Panicum virgatum]|uniref:Disease resistance protein n=1 Tax=Panicum virgatum TaxID=38727 RepID=A0A8T0RK31_PANVG|nr:hypothetical protein PVAP13_6KG393541 [Panicum virgatum]
MLKRMELTFLPELERWSENSAGEINRLVTFPRLEKLSIRDCDKLVSFPEIPVLTCLNLSRSKENNCATGAHVLMRMPLGYLSSIVRLNIEFLLVDVVMPPYGQPQQGQRSVYTLRCLHLKGDVSFASVFNKSKLQLGLDNCLVLVEELRINACSNIVRWPAEELRCLPRLRCLRIWFCSKLEGTGCSCSSSKEEEILWLPQLEILHISSCDSLLQIPKLAASLEEIYI